MGVSENRGPQYSTLNSTDPYYKDPKIRYPYFSETPYWASTVWGRFFCNYSRTLKNSANVDLKPEEEP